jgi:NAD(P)H-dependent FMN reductase
MNITIIAGSPRRPSLSKRVALHLQSRLKATEDFNISFINCQDYQLPFVQEVWTTEDKVPAEYKELYATMNATNVFIWVSPEYNGGYSPALKGLIDHFPKHTFKGKVTGIATSSNGKMGGMRAAMQLQLLSVALFSITCPVMLVTPEAHNKFDEEGNLTDAGFQLSIDNFLNEVKALARRLS